MIVHVLATPAVSDVFRIPNVTLVTDHTVDAAREAILTAVGATHEALVRAVRCATPFSHKGRMHTVVMMRYVPHSALAVCWFGEIPHGTTPPCEVRMPTHWGARVLSGVHVRDTPFVDLLQRMHPAPDGFAALDYFLPVLSVAENGDNVVRWTPRDSIGGKPMGFVIPKTPAVLAWLREIFFAVAVFACAGSPQTQTACLADSVFVLRQALHTYRGWDLCFTPTIRYNVERVWQHVGEEAILNALRGGYAPSLNAVPNVTYRLRLYHPFPFHFKTVDTDPEWATHVVESHAAVYTPSSVLNISVTGRPPAWPACEEDGEWMWRPFVEDDLKGFGDVEDAVARYLPFWRRTTAVIVTYSLMYTVRLVAFRTVAEARAEIMRLLATTAARFWMRDIRDVIEPVGDTNEARAHFVLEKLAARVARK